MRYFITAILFLSMVHVAIGQPDPNHSLAIQFYKNGEFDKAAVLFEDLYKKNASTDYYYRYYYNCLIKLEQYTKLEKIVKKQIKSNKKNPTYKVDLGYLFSQKGDLEKANSIYDDIIDNLSPDRNEIIRMASSFMNIREYKLAIRVYEKGRKLIRNYPFYSELANLYRITGNDTEMIRNYLDFIAYSPNQLKNTQNILSRLIDNNEVYIELQQQLYQRIQNYPELTYYNEMLIWVFIQHKDFNAALIQAKALDKRFNEDGQRIFNLAMAAINEKMYDAAIKSLNYLIDKGNEAENKYYFYARERILNVKKSKITSSYDYTHEELIQLKNGYLDFLNEFGANKIKAANTLRDLGYIEALYFHNLDTAIVILDQIVNTPGLNQVFVQECKLDLADYYLMKNEVWEATLLYSQVDLKMKDEPLGEMARFKNAKLSYYRGDFEWAQGQLDVLKGSTSELIANDALDLSVFITTNLGLDTSYEAMNIFVRADLLSYQNKDHEAMIVMDSIIELYPGHQLIDDIYLKKARIFIRKNQPEEAVKYLELILEQKADDLLMDDALFLLGDLYENSLNEQEKAKSYYERIILEFKDSVLVIEARERYRKLRGDQLN
jgi:tetratricopeptide (TPR) repeat protein